MSKKLIVISLICIMITAATPCVAQTGGLSNDGLMRPQKPSGYILTRCLTNRAGME